jgi:hypothetical protein
MVLTSEDAIGNDRANPKIVSEVPEDEGVNVGNHGARYFSREGFL